MLECGPATKSRRSIKGNPNAAVPLDSPEATQMLSRLDMDQPAETPAELPKFVDPPKPETPPSAPMDPAQQTPEPVPETIPPDQPLPEEYAAPEAESGSSAEYAEELEYEEAYEEESIATGKGKLYAIIGGVAALIIGLIILFPGGGEKKQPEDAEVTAPIEKGADANSFASYGFHSLLDEAVLRKANTAFSSDNKSGPSVPFPENDNWKFISDSKTLQGTAEQGRNENKNTRTVLRFIHESLSGFEFGVAFSVAGKGGGPQFQFSEIGAQTAAGLTFGFKEKEGGLGQVRSGGMQVQITTATSKIPASMTALYEELTKSGSVTEDVAKHYYLAARFDGKSVLLRDSTMDNWREATVDPASIARYAVDALHSVRLMDAAAKGSRKLTVKRYLLRNLTVGSEQSQKAVEQGESEDLMTGLTLDQSNQDGNDWSSRASADLAILSEGVKFLGLQAPVMTPLCVFGPQAFPIHTAEIKSGKKILSPEEREETIEAPIVAAVRAGRGKIVAFGSMKALYSEIGDNNRLVLNAIRWMDPSGSKTVGVRNFNNVITYLKRNGIKAQVIGGSGYHKQAETFDIICVPASIFDSHHFKNDIAKLIREKGMGVLVAGDVGPWRRKNPEGDLAASYYGNQFLARFGITWAHGSAPTNAPNGLAVTAPPRPLTHSGKALQSVLNCETADVQDSA